MTHSNHLLKIQSYTNALLVLAIVLLISQSAYAVPQEKKSAPKETRVPATIMAYESVDMYAKVGGYLNVVSTDIGDEVTAGQVLAVIDAPEFSRRLEQKQKLLELAKAEALQAKAHVVEIESSLEALQATVKEAKVVGEKKQTQFDFERIECERIARLANAGAIRGELLDSSCLKMKAAKADIESASAKVATANAMLSGGSAAVKSAEADAVAAAAKIDVAKADIEYAQKMIDYLTIKAPWDGKVTHRMYDAGAFVQSAEGNSAAKPILRLVRDDKVRVVFSLSQKHIRGLKNGVEVTLSDIEALPGENFKGTVTRFSGALDSKTRMMKVEMDLDNPDGKLTPGLFGYATVKLDP